jgi:hypothetical protein
MNTKPAIFITDPEEMLKARLSQPHQTSEQAEEQRLRLKRAHEQYLVSIGVDPDWLRASRAFISKP